MKTKQTLLLSVLLLIMSALTVSAQIQTKEKKVANVTFRVSMHCKSCQEKIERTIPFEKGIKDLTVDLEHKTVKVIYDPRKTDEVKIQNAFENLGYTCEKIQDETVSKSGTTRLKN